MIPAKKVPWMNWEEWREMYAALYSAEEEDGEDGISRAAVLYKRWSVRGNIPAAVESTMNLSLALSHERKGDSLEMRMELGYAVTRFVNGLVDPSQRGYYAKPVSVLARDMDIPEWIVDLRHDSTHNELPMLQPLKSAAKFALHWLRERYWEEQISIRKLFTKEVESALSKYVKLRELILRDDSGENEARRRALSLKTEAICQALQNDVGAGVLLGYVAPLLYDRGKFFFYRHVPANCDREQFFEHLYMVWDQFIEIFKSTGKSGRNRRVTGASADRLGAGADGAAGAAPSAFLDKIFLLAVDQYRTSGGDFVFGMWAIKLMQKFEFRPEVLGRALALIRIGYTSRMFDVWSVLVSKVGDSILESVAESQELSRVGQGGGNNDLTEEERQKIPKLDLWSCRGVSAPSLLEIDSEKVERLRKAIENAEGCVRVVDISEPILGGKLVETVVADDMAR